MYIYTYTSKKLFFSYLQAMVVIVLANKFDSRRVPSGGLSLPQHSPNRWITDPFAFLPSQRISIIIIILKFQKSIIWYKWRPKAKSVWKGKGRRNLCPCYLSPGWGSDRKYYVRDFTVNIHQKWRRTAGLRGNFWGQKQLANTHFSSTIPPVTGTFRYFINLAFCALPFYMEIYTWDE